MTDYSELVRKMRTCIGDKKCFEKECRYWSELGCMDGNICCDAAAAIEALQAELEKKRTADCWGCKCEKLEPKQRKLGRWEKAKPKGVVVYSDGYAECSSCHETIWLGWGMNFCPHCGVQNRIIDPDDYDGAKMDGPIITPCRGCSDYDGYGGCKSKGGCARAKMEVQDGE